MVMEAHLWAIGYEDMDRAARVRDQIAQLGWGAGKAGKYLLLEDLAVVVRHPDGSFTVEHEHLSGIVNIVGCATVGLLAGLVVLAPISAAGIGLLIGSLGAAALNQVGISETFVSDVEVMMKPGTSALFVLDDAGDMDVILHNIQGTGGTVLKTNVDVERAKLIQATLSTNSNAFNQPVTESSELGIKSIPRP